MALKKFLFSYHNWLTCLVKRGLRGCMCDVDDVDDVARATQGLLGLPGLPDRLAPHSDLKKK